MEERMEIEDLMIEDYTDCSAKEQHGGLYHYDRSPCRECKHFKDGVPRDTCRDYETCLLPPIKLPTVLPRKRTIQEYSSLGARLRAKDTYTGICRYPGCNERYVKGETVKGYCHKHYMYLYNKQKTVLDITGVRHELEFFIEDIKKSA